MSSLVRRLQIRKFQALGYSREKWVVEADPATALPRLREVRRAGEITDADDNPIGRRWPQFLPRMAS